MKSAYTHFAEHAARALLELEPQLSAHPNDGSCLQVRKPDGTSATLNLTPCIIPAEHATAAVFFSHVTTVTQLLSAYQKTRASLRFEDDIPDAMTTVSPYTTEFIKGIFERATKWLSNEQARLIAQWVQALDVYCAVKSVESLLYSRADLALLELAPVQGWQVHFDHLAIRCGTRAHHDAERVRDLLVNEHAYHACQLPAEAFYQFSDGWNAYPVYKTLSNGQVLRIFIDQSDAEDSRQIIQHWNHVYGYTAHHLAMRATRLHQGERIAVPLEEVQQALAERNIESMTPTGHYTGGLLLQVFTKPEKNLDIPFGLRNELQAIDTALPAMLENAKLLEIVSRRELPPDLAHALFKLYGLSYDVSNPLHSAPVYQYFLPEQAAHVIRTSQQI